MKTEITSSANGRVNLLGEHLDYNGGSVLPLQIDRYVKIFLSDNNIDQKIIIESKTASQEILKKYVISICKLEKAVNKTLTIWRPLSQIRNIEEEKEKRGWRKGGGEDEE